MEKKPPLPPEMINQFVRAAHGDLEQVKNMLAEEPKLINASWDWGEGDWESALGGASHTGQRDIALFLLENGAHMTIFAAAMLGLLDVVKTIISHHPNSRHYAGPHGIPLIVHAKQGGLEAEAVVDYLNDLDKG